MTLFKHVARIHRAALVVFAVLLVCPASKSQTFEEQQLRFERVKEAREATDSLLRALALEKGLAYPVRSLFIRAFKRERILELWGRDNPGQVFALIRSYAIAGFSGTLGPKRMRGDMQIPEGFYEIRGRRSFNPVSNFHLSMLVDYPNASDRKLGVKGRLGGEICVHGSDVTIGCLPITDEGIKEVYWLAVQAMSRGQDRIPIHIFPARLDSTTMATLEQEYAGSKDATGHDLVAFWKSLQPGYRWFEMNKTQPNMHIGVDGAYVIGRQR